MRLFLLRHGETVSNLERRYLGKTDEPLSEAGMEDLIREKESGYMPVPEMVFSGPMRRCRQTAEILFPQVKICVIPEWTEIDFGSFEGKNHRELKGNETYQKWIDSGGILSFPEGESREAFTARTLRGFERMSAFIQEARQEAGDGVGLEIKQRMERLAFGMEALAVVHGGTIMALCSSLFGGDYFDYQVGCGEGFSCLFRVTPQGVEAGEISRLGWHEKRETGGTG